MANDRKLGLVHYRVPVIQPPDGPPLTCGAVRLIVVSQGLANIGISACVPNTGDIEADRAKIRAALAEGVAKAILESE